MKVLHTQATGKHGAAILQDNREKGIKQFCSNYVIVLCQLLIISKKPVDFKGKI
jgi:hypothetical protein